MPESCGRTADIKTHKSVNSTIKDYATQENQEVGPNSSLKWE